MSAKRVRPRADFAMEDFSRSNKGNILRDKLHQAWLCGGVGDGLVNRLLRNSESCMRAEGKPRLIGARLEIEIAAVAFLILSRSPLSTDYGIESTVRGGRCQNASCVPGAVIRA